MSVYTSQKQEDMYYAENRMDDIVNSLNSMRDGSSNPVKVAAKIKRLISELEFIRSEYPESDYCDLSNVVFGLDVVEHFKLNDLLLGETK